MTLSHAHTNPQKPTRVVVLGSGGFLGKPLLQACAAAGIASLGLASKDIDLTDTSAGAQLAQRLRPMDVLIFLAALTPDKGRDSATLMRNLAMCRAVCEATRSVQLAQLVYASSDAVYSFDTSLISEQTPPVSVDLYGGMHRMRELILSAEAKAPLAMLRITGIYGAGDTHNSYGPNRFIRQALKEGRISLFGNGEENRDHLYVQDVVDLILRIAAHGSIGLVNFATGTSTTFRAIADMIAAHAGRTVEIVPSPRQSPVTHRHFDTGDLLRAFPGLRFKPLEEGLAATLADARAHG